MNDSFTNRYIDRFRDFLLNMNLSEAKPINYIFRN